MSRKPENRFGWGALLAAFFGGAFFSQVIMKEPPDRSAPGSAPASGQVEAQPFAALPGTDNALLSEAPVAEVVEADPVFEPQPIIAPPAAPEREVYYANCSAARAAGAAPVYADEPGYSRRLDRDGDGVGCE